MWGKKKLVVSYEGEIVKKPESLFLICVFSLAMVLPLPAVVAPYQDVRNKDLSCEALSESLIRTLWFNQGTIFPRHLAIFADSVLESGKNPGLGVRSLHQQGLIGQGVNVAIIDDTLAHYRNLQQMHPEFSGKLIDYMDIGTGLPADLGSMHGPAVTSLLVGEAIGTAPGARVYYVAVPNKPDAKYYADALNLITIATQEQGLNIRVVSISAAPSGPGSSFINQDAYDEAVMAAENAGILVLDCGLERLLDIYFCYYDINDPENVALATPGLPGMTVPHTCSGNQIHVPNSFRTQAEQYSPDDFHYQYMGRGGISWAIPYVAGILALGWELKPQLTAEEMVDLLLLTAYKKNGCKIINPQAFIKAVKKVK
jgi:serine protease AprX